MSPVRPDRGSSRSTARLVELGDFDGFDANDLGQVGRVANYRLACTLGVLARREDLDELAPFVESIHVLRGRTKLASRRAPLIATSAIRKHIDARLAAP